MSNPGVMAIHFERAERLFRRRWYAAALWEWQQHLPAARREPAELARTFNAMATTLMEQGEYRQAYIKAELARDVSSQLAQDHPQAFYAHLNAALAAFSIGDLEIARGLAERALTLSTSADVPSDRRAQVLGIFALIAINNEEYDVASTWLKRVRDLPPVGEQWRIKSALTVDAAICCGCLEAQDDAEPIFAEALDLAVPDDLANIYVERGWMRLRHGDVTGAISDAREVVDALLACPAFLTLPEAADGLMLLAALARTHGNEALSSQLYVQGFAWLATAGWRAHLRRSTRTVAQAPVLPPRKVDLPKWADLVHVTEVLTAGEHRGPAPAQRFGRTVHAVAGQFSTNLGQDVLGTAAVMLRMPDSVRRMAALPAQALVRRLERGHNTYDTSVLAVLDHYDRALVEEGQPYPAVLERMTREAGTSWDPRAVHRILLAHAS